MFDSQTHIGKPGKSENSFVFVLLRMKVSFGKNIRRQKIFLLNSQSTSSQVESSEHPFGNLPSLYGFMRKQEKRVYD